MFYSKDGGAERMFREAFERLKSGKPEVLPVGTPVTQSNVAREARRNPCALAKHRYPSLINEIQSWIAAFANDVTPPSKAQATLSARRRELELITIERDLALSMLVEADARMLQLTREFERLQGARVTVEKGSLQSISA